MPKDTKDKKPKVKKEWEPKSIKRTLDKIVKSERDGPEKERTH